MMATPARKRPPRQLATGLRWLPRDQRLPRFQRFPRLPRLQRPQRFPRPQRFQRPQQLLLLPQIRPPARQRVLPQPYAAAPADGDARHNSAHGPGRRLAHCLLAHQKPKPQGPLLLPAGRVHPLPAGQVARDTAGPQHLGHQALRCRHQSAWLRPWSQQILRQTQHLR